MKSGGRIGFIIVSFKNKWQRKLLISEKPICALFNKDITPNALSLPFAVALAKFLWLGDRGAGLALNATVGEI